MCVLNVCRRVGVHIFATSACRMVAASLAMGYMLLVLCFVWLISAAAPFPDDQQSFDVSCEKSDTKASSSQLLMTLLWGTIVLLINTAVAAVSAMLFALHM